LATFKEFREYLAEKLNPAQPLIAAMEKEAGPSLIADWKLAYEEIEIVHRAIEMCINALVSVPFEVQGGPAKKINKLLNVRPNPFEDRVAFFRRAFLDYYIDGNAFFFHDSKEDEGSSLYILPANNMTIVPDVKKYIERFDYFSLTNSNQVYGMFGSNRKNKEEGISFTPREIIHIKNDSHTSTLRGDSKLKNLDRLINLYYSLINFQSQFFQNNAIPGFVLSTETRMSPKMKDRLLAEWKTGYSTIHRGGRSPAILDGGLKIDPFSKINFSEMDFEGSVERVQIDLAKGLGVPYVLLKSGNNANLKNNQILFYTQTILPILEQFASAFAHKFGPEVTIKPDTKSIPALRDDVDKQAKFWTTLVNTGIATASEAREDLRLPKMEGAEVDKIRMPQNITGSATNPSVGGRPQSSEDKE
jgi:HK97 family phage portal protein